eukprot:3139195-Pleurochrysis_carterae.AAC.1
MAKGGQLTSYSPRVMVLVLTTVHCILTSVRNQIIQHEDDRGYGYTKHGAESQALIGCLCSSIQGRFWIAVLPTGGVNTQYA